MGRRWGTVCNRNQGEIAGAVCSQLGFPNIGLNTIYSKRKSAKDALLKLSSTGAQATSTFLSAGAPIHNCTVKSNGHIECDLISDGACDHYMDLWVTCSTYSEITTFEICQQNVDDFTAFYASFIATGQTCPTACNSAMLANVVSAMGAVIGILVALQTVTIICFCVIFSLKRCSSKQRLLNA